MTENTKELEEAIEAGQKALDIANNVVDEGNRPVRVNNITPLSMAVLLDAARAHLEAAPVLDELIEALQDALIGHEWYEMNFPEEFNECDFEWRDKAKKAIEAANALQKLVERKG